VSYVRQFHYPDFISANAMIDNEMDKKLSSGMLRRVALVRTDVSEERSASIRNTNIISSKPASVASYG
jgi:hypothetical protein